MADTEQTPDFETSLKRLEALVSQMEQGDMPIEDKITNDESTKSDGRIMSVINFVVKKSG